MSMNRAPLQKASRSTHALRPLVLAPSAVDEGAAQPSHRLTKTSTAILFAAILAAVAVWTTMGAGSLQRLPPSATGVTYPTNAAGQSYGSAVGPSAGIPTSQQPDLIKAIGTDSSGSYVTGYVVKLSPSSMR